MVLLSLKSPTIFQVEISILKSCPWPCIFPKYFALNSLQDTYTEFNDAFRRKVIVAICHNWMSFWKYVFGFLRYSACRFIRYKDSCERLYLKYWVFDVRDPHCPIHLVTSSISYFWTSNTSYVIWCNGAFCTTLIFAAVMPSKNLKVNRG